MVPACSVLVSFFFMFPARSLRLLQHIDIGVGCQPIDNSLCRQSPQSKPLLVTSNGGSGTHTIQKIFALNGIHMGHEAIQKEGSVSWPYAVDVSKSNQNKECAWLRPPRTTFNHVVHLVRCPRDVVSALQSHALCSLKYIRDTLKLNFEEHELRTPKFFMSAWLKWNQHIESYADSRYRIDEFLNKETLINISNLAGFDLGDHPVLPTAHANHRHHDSLTWAQLRSADEGLAEQLHDKAREYGFAESCLDDGMSMVAEESPISSDTIITIDGDGILWHWERASVQNMCQSQICFEKVQAAKQHLDVMRNIELSNLSSEIEVAMPGTRTAGRAG